MDMRDREGGGGYGMNILIGFVYMMYASVVMLLLWFFSEPENRERMKKRW